MLAKGETLYTLMSPATELSHARLVICPMALLKPSANNHGSQFALSRSLYRELQDQALAAQTMCSLLVVSHAIDRSIQIGFESLDVGDLHTAPLWGSVTCKAEALKAVLKAGGVVDGNEVHEAIAQV